MVEQLLGLFLDIVIRFRGARFLLLHYLRPSSFLAL
jgi:hypothetical protein